jgi:hypothetical protein
MCESPPREPSMHSIEPAPMRCTSSSPTNAQSKRSSSGLTLLRADSLAGTLAFAFRGGPPILHAPRLR